MKKLVTWLLVIWSSIAFAQAQMIATDQQPNNNNKTSIAASATGISQAIGDTLSKQFMTIPLSRTWLKRHNIDYQISEWWIYSTGEQTIHGLINHRSVDYVVPYGTPVYAPVDGFIQASYYNTTLGEIGKRTMYQDKTINYGLWYWVQIVYPDPAHPLDPSKVTFIQIAHLSRFAATIAQTIKWLDYVYDAAEDAVKIDNYALTYTQLAFILRGMNTRVIPVKQWDLIGYAGKSGLEWWEEIWSWYVPKMYTKDPNLSRDEAHLHVQLYERWDTWWKKPWSTKDIYHLWTGAIWSQYPTHTNWLMLTPWHLFKSKDGKLPDYAK